MRKLNIQCLVETVLYILFATALLAIIISDGYLPYVTPRMKPYLYFAVVILFIFGILGFFRLFQFSYKPKITHCLVILIPLVILLIPKNGIDLHSLSSGYINGSDLNGKTILPLLLPLHILSAHHKIKKIIKNRPYLPLLMDI